MKEISKLLLIFLSYSIAGKLGLQFAYINDSATAIWAPSGIALASMLLFGYRVWPAIFLGAFFTNLTTAGTVATSLGIALGNTLEGLSAAYLINTFAHGKHAFLRAQDIFKFTILGAFLSTTISANIGVLTLILGNYADWQQFGSIWLTWWIGDLSGILITAPLLIFWTARHPLYSLRHSKMEALIAFLVLIIIAVVLYGGMAQNYPVAFICIPAIVWIAFRFGRRETMTAIIFLSGCGLWGTLNGFGPFVRPNHNESLLFLQAFMDVMTVTAMALSVAVSEKRNAEEAVEKKEEWFRALIEKSSDAMSLTDPKGNIVYVSPSFTNVLGYKPEEVIGKSGLSFIHPDDVQHAIAVTAHIIHKSGQSAKVEIRCKHKNNSIRYIEVTSTNQLHNPNLNAVVSNFHDVTERTEAADKIAKEKAEAVALLSSIGDGILATDPDGRIILVNNAFEEMLGFTNKDIVGKIADEQLDMEDDKGKSIASNTRPLKLALAAGKKITATHYLVRKDGSKFPALITATPVVSKKKIIGAVKIFHDITREKELDQAKDEFISLASHELRTPMTAIRGLIAMILEGDYGPINSGLKKPLDNIHISSDRQIHLINDLLDVSRLKTGRMHYSVSNFTIDNVIAEIVTSLEPLAKQKAIKLEFKPGKNQLVQADIQWIKQVLNNLIGNALKYTMKGGVTISTSEDRNHILVIVTDTGLGIDPSEQDKLFGRFRQLESNTATKSMGSGLGLYISRSVARKLGGDIVLEKSHKGKGSTFVFSIAKAGTVYAKKASEDIAEYMQIANETQNG